MGGTVKLLAHSDVTFTESGDTFFSNNLAGTAVLSLGSALVDVKSNATISAHNADLEATIKDDITANTNSATATVKIVAVTVLDDPEVKLAGTINLTGDLVAEAASDVTINTTTAPKDGGSSSSDAAVATSIVKSDPKLTVSGGSIDA